LVSHKGKKLVRSSHFDSLTGKLKKLSKNVLLMSKKESEDLAKNLSGTEFIVTKVEKKRVARKPAPPFITSTLQQECNRKLRLSSKETMSLAQKLYEQGLITYMRTDSVFLSNQALKTTRTFIEKLYGTSYLSLQPRVYRKKVKGAQEAHEAIRPAGEPFIEPEKTKLSGALRSVYELIWKRTLASQMKDCQQNQVKITFQAKESTFMSSGMSIEFPGFYIIYKDQEEHEVKLPVLKEKDKVPCLKAEALRHETKPPARYTEASLVQKLEQEGVGRPSTYASIIGTIQERGYVKKESNSLIPTFTALIVTKLLRQHFPDYVDIKFTSEMEKYLDDIAQGKKNHTQYLKSVYYGKKGLKEQVEHQEKAGVEKSARSMVLKGLEEYSFYVGPFGAYVSKIHNRGEEVSASLPEGMVPGKLNKDQVEKLIQNKMKQSRALGKDPETGEEIFVLSGRYGPYIQRGGDFSEEKKNKKHTKRSNDKNSQKRKRVSLSPFFEEETITFSKALKLLELPKIVGVHHDTGQNIKKGVGRFGPYIVHNGNFSSVTREGLFEMTPDYALHSLNEPNGNPRQSALKDFIHTT